jgi:hypothetical protein
VPRVRLVNHLNSGIDVVVRVGEVTWTDDRAGYLSQLVDQLERLQLERGTSTPEESVEVQAERLQLERAKSALRPPSAVFQDERLHEERE